MQRIEYLIDRLNKGNIGISELKELKMLVYEREGKTLDQYLLGLYESQSTEISNEVSSAIWSNVELVTKGEPKASPFNLGIGLPAVYWAMVAGLALLISVGAWYLIKNGEGQAEQIILTAESADQDIRLEDGTNIKLGKGSQLIYSNQFSRDQRLVELLGHAYFDVTHDETQPFEVKHGEFITRVLGTTFEIQTTDLASKATKVSLFEGKVEVLDKSGHKWNLLPGEQLNVSAGQHGFKTTFETGAQAFWRLGIWTFEQVSFSELIEFANENYAELEIEAHGADILNAQVSGSITKEDDLVEVLELICFSKGWRIERISMNKVVIK